MKVTVHVLAFFLALAAAVPGCKNPLEEESKKERVRVLVDDLFEDIGKYVLFWDGRDSDGKPVPPGKYIIIFEVKDFQEQDFLTAEAGKASEEVRDPNSYTFGYYSNYELGQPYPDPFKILSGVNIPIYISHVPAPVKVSIYKD